ncbi:hypothetical protein C8J56DRAFT_929099 [Mycena floridula]|nr:hypothetical protein C8J56DRAFT_929099 [Mycena floridula]
MSDSETNLAPNVHVMAGNNNPTGINQYKDCAPQDCERTKAALWKYHRAGITDKHKISALLKADHDITLSASSVTRRKKDWGIKGSRVTMNELPETTKRQLVLDQMAQDPAGNRGPRTVKEGIARQTGIHLTRDFITEEMRVQEPEGFAAREPSAKKVHRTPLVSLGIHHEWSGDGHDKLAAIGFPIWGVRDKWCGRWLGLWVVPNNRLKLTIAYLFLMLVLQFGGIPIQMTTDCGSETTAVFGLVNALREIFAGHLDINELPAHRFLQSVYNITIERGWLRLRLHWGDNVKIFWEAGAGIYNAANPVHYDLVHWLWPMLIQAELDDVKDTFNDHATRKDRGKKLPSGDSPNVMYSLHRKFGGENCLIPVDTEIVKELMEELGGEDLIRFVTVEYADHAKAVFDSLDMPLTMQNVWQVFQLMLPLM